MHKVANDCVQRSISEYEGGGFSESIGYGGGASLIVVLLLLLLDGLLTSSIFITFMFLLLRVSGIGTLCTVERDLCTMDPSTVVLSTMSLVPALGSELVSVFEVALHLQYLQQM